MRGTGALRWTEVAVLAGVERIAGLSGFGSGVGADGGLPGSGFSTGAGSADLLRMCFLERVGGQRRSGR